MSPRRRENACSSHVSRTEVRRLQPESSGIKKCPDARKKVQQMLELYRNTVLEVRDKEAVRAKRDQEAWRAGAREKAATSRPDRKVMFVSTSHSLMLFLTSQNA